VRRSVGEREKPCHLNQQAKHPPKRCFGDVLATKALDRFSCSGNDEK